MLTTAEGEGPNPLFAPAAVKTPLVSAELKDFQQLAVRQVYEYDIETVAGQTYQFTQIK